MVPARLRLAAGAGQQPLHLRVCVCTSGRGPGPGALGSSALTAPALRWHRPWRSRPCADLSFTRTHRGTQALGTGPRPSLPHSVLSRASMSCPGWPGPHGPPASASQAAEGLRCVPHTRLLCRPPGGALQVWSPGLSVLPSLSVGRPLSTASLIRKGDELGTQSPRGAQEGPQWPPLQQGQALLPPGLEARRGCTELPAALQLQPRWPQQRRRAWQHPRRKASRPHARPAQAHHRQEGRGPKPAGSEPEPLRTGRGRVEGDRQPKLV